MATPRSLTDLIQSNNAADETRAARDSGLSESGRRLAALWPTLLAELQAAIITTNKVLKVSGRNESFAFTQRPHCFDHSVAVGDLSFDDRKRKWLSKFTIQATKPGVINWFHQGQEDIRGNFTPTDTARHEWEHMLTAIYQAHSRRLAIGQP